MQKAMSFKDIAIVRVKGSSYRTHFWYMSKDDAVTLMYNSNVIDKKNVLYCFFLYKRWLCATPKKKLIIKKTEI